MRAAVISQPGAATLSTLPLGEPAPGQVRVQVEGCGVCGSNLPVWEGQPWFTYPLAPGAPGHEGWGIVDAIGDGVTTCKTGDRVAMLSSNAFAEFDIASADHLAAIPESLHGQVLPAEAIACALNVFRRSQITAGSTVAIVGAGFLGMVVLQLAVNAGARVTAMSRRRWVRDVATALGAEAAVTADGSGASEARAVAGSDGFSCVIEAAGVQAALDLATNLTREHGRLVIAGYHQDGPRTVDMQTWNWRGLDVINAHERDPRVYVSAMRDAMAAVERGEIAIDRLCTHAFELDHLGDALNMLRDRPDGFLKGVVQL